MARVQNKPKKQVVSIDTGRQSLTSELLADRLYTDFEEDWSTTLERLKTEISQIDRAILALTQLALGRGQHSLSPTGGAEQKECRRCPPKQKIR